MNMTEEAQGAAHQQVLVEFRPQMLKFARLQLQDEASAEDVVQDTMAAALAGMQGFLGRAAFKTWVFTILRHKIVDLLRHRGRLVEVASLERGEEDMDEAFETLFKANAHWHATTRPRNWGDPEEALNQRQFWQIFEACLEVLPAKTARVFMMREFLGFETEEICRNLEISTSNCHVVLHRARSGLRQCLEKGWFLAGEVSPC